MTTTDVYRLYAGDLEDGLDLVYVGISSDARGRFRQHRKRGFWEFVTYATVTTYATRDGAEAVEAHAIATESPWFNIHPGSWRARHANVADVEWHEFAGYAEYPIGLSDEEWAA